MSSKPNKASRKEKEKGERTRSGSEMRDSDGDRREQQLTRASFLPPELQNTNETLMGQGYHYDTMNQGSSMVYEGKEHTNTGESGYGHDTVAVPLDQVEHMVNANTRHPFGFSSIVGRHATHSDYSGSMNQITQTTQALQLHPSNTQYDSSHTQSGIYTQATHSGESYASYPAHDPTSYQESSQLQYYGSPSSHAQPQSSYASYSQPHSLQGYSEQNHVASAPGYTQEHTAEPQQYSPSPQPTFEPLKTVSADWYERNSGLASIADQASSHGGSDSLKSKVHRDHKDKSQKSATASYSKPEKSRSSSEPKKYALSQSPFPLPGPPPPPHVKQRPSPVSGLMPIGIIERGEGVTEWVYPPSDSPENAPKTATPNREIFGWDSHSHRKRGTGKGVWVRHLTREELLSQKDPLHSHVRRGAVAVSEGAIFQNYVYPWPAGAVPKNAPEGWRVEVDRGEMSAASPWGTNSGPSFKQPEISSSGSGTVAQGPIPGSGNAAQQASSGYGVSAYGPTSGNEFITQQSETYGAGFNTAGPGFYSAQPSGINASGLSSEAYILKPSEPQYQAPIAASSVVVGSRGSNGGGTGSARHDARRRDRKDEIETTKRSNRHKK